MAILVLSHAGDSVRDSLREAGLEPQALVVGEVAAALEQLGHSTWQMVLIDADVAGGAALDLVEPLAASGHTVAVLSARPTLQLTMRALRAGANDVLAVPPSVERLRQLATTASEPPSPPLTDAGTATEWVGSSPALLDAFRSAVRLAAADTPVLIRGETGTGKELLARLIHEHSGRAAGPFVGMNCGALPEPVLSAELFGRSAGTIAGGIGRRTGRAIKADGGTLLLSEANRLSPRLQWSVVRLLERGEVEPLGEHEPRRVDVRIIATVDEEPGSDAPSGWIPELWYRFTAGTLYLPPLRERGSSDVRLLANHFVREHAERYGHNTSTIAEDAWTVLQNHSWPGNVRQLRGALERAVLEAAGGPIHLTHLPRELRRTAERQPSELSMTLADLEKRHILRALELSDGHIAQTANRLGIHRNTLRRKLQAYGIETG